MNVTAKLPALDSAIVRTPDHHITLGEPGVRRRIHITRTTTGAWQWAHLLYAVGGWTVTAAGELPAEDAANHATAAQTIEDHYREGNGDGVDRLPLDAFTVIGKSREAHIRRDDPTATYCGKTSGTQAVFDTSVKGHARQHCIDCDATYRAEHWGRIALPAH
ncbi:hypothetical protein [Streptomyces mirabilis]|uniref:hypothetical protein n=1 Tax=Streptomyces mirabilis TaxID=68239 RepID=UPI0036CB0F79